MCEVDPAMRGSSPALGMWISFIFFPTPRSCLKDIALRERCGAKTIWMIPVIEPYIRPYINFYSLSDGWIDLQVLQLPNTGLAIISMAYQACPLPIWKGLPVSFPNFHLWEPVSPYTQEDLKEVSSHYSFILFLDLSLSPFLSLHSLWNIPPPSTPLQSPILPPLYSAKVR